MWECDDIDDRDDTIFWKLKGNVSELFYRLVVKILPQVRNKNLPFSQEFYQVLFPQMMETMLQMMRDSHTKFIGTKTLQYAIKFFTLVFNNKMLHEFSGQHMEEILLQHSFILLISSHADYLMWTDDPIEYIRSKFDNRNHNDTHILAAKPPTSHMNLETPDFQLFISANSTLRSS